MRPILFCAAALAAVLAAPAPSAHAEDRDFCADRPGLGTPACTLAPGKVMAEITAGQWLHDKDAATVSDSATLAALLVRLGLTPSLELQAGFGGHVTARTRDRASGLTGRARGVGDAFVALRQGLAGPNGPVAVEAFVTAPLSHQPIGSGEWGAGVLLPASAKLPAGFELAVTPEIDAAVDSDGNGRHLAYGGVAGVSHALGKTLSLEVEAAAFRDNDPSGHATDASLAASLSWQVAPDLQVDFEADAGITANAPGRVLTVGFARRF